MARPAKQDGKLPCRYCIVAEKFSDEKLVCQNILPFKFILLCVGFDVYLEALARVMAIKTSCWRTALFNMVIRISDLVDPAQRLGPA
jgi:hypothetical protein